MLTCYGHRVRLPQSDLAYLAFRLALRDTLSDIETHLDFEEASWVTGADDEDPPAIFPTAEAAYRAWQRSQVVAKAREKRRKEALKRLGRPDP